MARICSYAIPRLKRLEFSLQRNRERELALTRFENKIAATKRAPLPQRLSSASCSSVNFGKAMVSVSR